MKSSGLLRATLTLLAGSALAQLLPLLLGPWLTRIYTPTEFGQFGFMWALASNLAVVGCARYEFALPMETQDSKAAVLLALCARVLVCVLGVAVLIGLLLWRWQDLALAWGLPLAVLAAALTQALTLWSTRAQRFQALAVARVLQYGGGAVLQLLLGLAGVGVAGLLLGPVVAGLLAVVLLARPAPLGGWVALWRVPRPELKAMASKHRDFPLLNTPHAFAGALQDSLAMVLIAAWSGDASAGYWALALRYLKAPASLVGGALSQVLYPRLVQCQGNAAESLRLVRQSMALLMLLALPMMAGLMLWGPTLFAAVFGERWQDAGELARALAPYIALHFVASPLSVAMMAWGAQAWGLRLALVGQLMFVLGLAAGLALGGLIGAAWGVSAAMLAYFAYFFWALANWHSFPAPQNLAPNESRN